MRDLHPVILFLYRLAKPALYAFMKSPRQGSRCTVYAATAPECATAGDCSGAYFMRLLQERLPPAVLAGPVTGAGQRLWEVSQLLTGASGL